MQSSFCTGYSSPNLSDNASFTAPKEPESPSPTYTVECRLCFSTDPVNISTALSFSITPELPT